nr:tyrosine-type recombinase/integrase [Blastopirellula marina]
MEVVTQDGSSWVNKDCARRVLNPHHRRVLMLIEKPWNRRDRTDALACRAHITKRVTAHTFRHSFATHLIEVAYDIRTVQELLVHRDFRTTMIYTPVLNQGSRGVRIPADSD